MGKKLTRLENWMGGKNVDILCNEICNLNLVIKRALVESGKALIL